jgi:nitrogen fixation protein NifU and related proteins
MDLYRDIILDHYKNPHNFGHLDHSDANASGTNASCGDQIEIEVIFKKNKTEKMITDIKFSGIGCAISQASASMLTDLVKGKTITQIKKIKETDIEKMLGTTLTPSRVKCATLPLEVINQIIKLQQK